VPVVSQVLSDRLLQDLLQRGLEMLLHNFYLTHYLELRLEQMQQLLPETRREVLVAVPRVVLLESLVLLLEHWEHCTVLPIWDSR